jgi:hypothetical protein
MPEMYYITEHQLKEINRALGHINGVAIPFIINRTHCYDQLDRGMARQAQQYYEEGVNFIERTLDRIEREQSVDDARCVIGNEYAYASIESVPAPVKQFNRFSEIDIV